MPATPITDQITTDAETSISGSVFADNGFGPDIGNNLAITAINGVAASVGQQITLASGALVTLNADGTFNYDPNGAFEALVDGETGTDSFTYALTDGIFAALLELSGLNGSNGFVLGGIDAGDESGRSVSTAGDVNGDGIDDLIIGAPYADSNGNTRAGESYVVFGSSAGFSSSLDLSSLNGSNGFVLRGIGPRDLSGGSVSAAGDVNGDGIDDLIIGARGAALNGNSAAGESYVVFGRANFAPTIDMATVTLTIDGVNDAVILGTSGDDDLVGDNSDNEILGLGGDDVLDGGAGNDLLVGGTGNDVLGGGDGNDLLVGFTGDDTLNGGPGADTLNGGEGDDFIFGGPDTGDLRDVIFAGEGNDSIDAGAGNDEVYGQDGNDTIAGGAGVDTLQGQNGDDVITGSNFSDLIFGNAGDDFVNGGFGSDRINGGSGADRFFHVGVEGHGSDWLQDYSFAEGDVLLYGGTATRDQFQVNFTNTAGDAGVAEAFVIFRPTDQILWALVDGAGEAEITLRLNGQEFDLLG